METTLDSLDIGDFFVWECSNKEKKTIQENDSTTIDIYQKIEKMGEYNAVLINSGKPCVIFPSAPILKKITVEFKAFPPEG